MRKTIPSIVQIKYLVSIFAYVKLSVLAITSLFSSNDVLFPPPTQNKRSYAKKSLIRYCKMNENSGSSINLECKNCNT